MGGEGALGLTASKTKKMGKEEEGWSKRRPRPTHRLSADYLPLRVVTHSSFLCSHTTVVSSALSTQWSSGSQSTPGDVTGDVKETWSEPQQQRQEIKSLLGRTQRLSNSVTIPGGRHEAAFSTWPAGGGSKQKPGF